MKKTLLLQTALVAAAGLFVADVANAQVKAEPLGVTVGGYFTQFMRMQDAGAAQASGSGSTTPAAGTDRGTNFSSDAEIWFNIRGVLDNGIVVGGRVELEASSYNNGTQDDQIDERYLFLERADIGRIELGSTDRVTGKMLYFAPNSLPGHSTTVHSDYPSAAVTPLMWFQNSGHDNEGINIYTASNRYFGSKAGKGLQLGFSYVPDGCQDLAGCGGTFGGRSNKDQISDQYAVAANYLESFGPVDAALYAGYTSALTEADARDDRYNGWQVGTQFSWNVGGGSAVQFGGGYSTEDTSTIADRDAYTVGVRYLTNGAAPGSVGIGVEYYNREDALRAGGTNELDYYHLGVTYQLATGVLTFAGIGVSDYDAAANTSDNKQTFGVIGIGLNF